MKNFKKSPQPLFGQAGFSLIETVGIIVIFLFVAALLSPSWDITNSQDGLFSSFVRSQAVCTVSEVWNGSSISASLELCGGDMRG